MNPSGPNCGAGQHFSQAMVDQVPRFGIKRKKKKKKGKK